MGIDLGRLRREVEEYLERLKNYESQPFAFYDLNISIIDEELRKADQKRGRLRVAKNISPWRRQIGCFRFSGVNWSSFRP